jgi:HAD superfamily hydrolase (TIGR01490 family)
MPTRPDLALFDFDGTLTTCETFPLFVQRVLPKSRLLAGWLRLWPLVLGYRLRLVSGTRLRAAIVKLGLEGADAEALAQAGARFAAENLPGVLRPEAMARLRWHRERGDRVVIVSGGLGVYLRPWAAGQGLEVLCSELEALDGRCTGAFAGAQCVGSEKARRVCERIDIAGYGEVFAYGDTHEDAELLALADHPVYRGRPIAGSTCVR